MKAKLPKIEFVACHRMPERSFSLKGRQFPVCARCTGMLLGYLSFPFFLLNFFAASLWIGLLLNLPAYVDGVTQAAEMRQSNNWLRLVTGLMSGIGQMGIVSWIGHSIGLAIVKLIKGGF
ncbi:MAG: DUF2085 domain-containing protein [bacterium]